MGFVDKQPSRMQGQKFFRSQTEWPIVFNRDHENYKYDGVMAWQSGAHVVLA